MSKVSDSIQEFDFSTELRDYVDKIEDFLVCNHNKLTRDELRECLCFVSRAGYKCGLNTLSPPDWAFDKCPNLRSRKGMLSHYNY